MKKYEKNILIVSLISLVLTIILGCVTGLVAVGSAVKLLKNEGVKDIKSFVEYGQQKIDEISDGGKIVVDEKGEEKVIIDFSEGIHVNTGDTDVRIDKTGIHVTEE